MSVWNKALRWLTVALVSVLLLKMAFIRAWDREALAWRRLAEAGAQACCQMMIKWIYPAGTSRREDNIWRCDPSYAVYQRYRYTYDTYVYLFSDGERDTGLLTAASGAEIPDAGVSGAELYAAENGGSGGDGMGNGNSMENGAGSGIVGNTGSGNGAGDVPALAQLQDYDFLMKHFYSVHPSTTAGRDIMKADTFLGTDLRVCQDSTVPQILIYHTHSQETYADYGPSNKSASVVAVGSYLTSLLEAKGWNVIHDTTAYDIKGGKLDRNRAYTYALEGITGILKEHPTIQVIIDLHRDGVRENVRLAAEVNGKPTAQIMFFEGMSRTPEGEISYLENPNLEGNLAFAFQMQLQAAREFPGFTRKIYLKGLRYNLHLRPRSALIEVGAQTNTGQEALNAMEPLAEVLDRVLQGG